jgi:hypothetical protein
MIAGFEYQLRNLQQEDISIECLAYKIFVPSKQSGNFAWFLSILNNFLLYIVQLLENCKIIAIR